MKTKRIFAMGLLLLITRTIGAGNQEAVEQFCRLNEQRLLKEYFSFLAIPNVASDLENIGKNAAWISTGLREKGLEPILLKASDTKAPPVVYAEWNQPGAKRTLLFYAHYDGQPVTPSDWT